LRFAAGKALPKARKRPGQPGIVAEMVTASSLISQANFNQYAPFVQECDIGRSCRIDRGATICNIRAKPHRKVAQAYKRPREGRPKAGFTGNGAATGPQPGVAEVRKRNMLPASRLNARGMAGHPWPGNATGRANEKGRANPAFFSC